MNSLNQSSSVTNTKLIPFGSAFLYNSLIQDKDEEMNRQCINDINDIGNILNINNISSSMIQYPFFVRRWLWNIKQNEHLVNNYQTFVKTMCELDLEAIVLFYRQLYNGRISTMNYAMKKIILQVLAFFNFGQSSSWVWKEFCCISCTDNTSVISFSSDCNISIFFIIILIIQLLLPFIEFLIIVQI